MEFSRTYFSLLCQKPKTAALTTALKDHYHPKPIVISERFSFHKRNQKEGEVTDYVVALKKLSIDCEIGTSLQDAL